MRSLERMPRWLQQKMLAALVLVVVALPVLAACGSGGAASARPLRIGLVTSTAGLGDAGLNDLAAAGLRHGEAALDVHGEIAQPRTSADIASALRHDAQAGDDLVIAVGDEMEHPLADVAQHYPLVRFALIDAMPLGGNVLQYTLQLPNVASLYFDDQQAGALAGSYAGLLAQQRQASGSVPRIDVFGTAPVPPTSRFLTGFTWAVKRVPSGARVAINYTRVPDAPQTSPSCRTVVRRAIAAGARILLGLDAPCQSAAIAAANTHRLTSIGLYDDQRAAGASVAASVLERADVATYSAIQDVRDGTFHSGVHAYDLASGDITLAPGHTTLSASQSARMQTLEQQLRTRQIVPPQFPPQ